MDEHTDRRPPWVPWAFMSLALVVVAGMAYGLGVHSQGIAGAEADSARHWNWGFPGFAFFILWFWMFGIFRWTWWGPRRPWRYHYRYRRYDDDYDDWHEWHRREHERMDNARGPKDAIT